MKRFVDYTDIERSTLLLPTLQYSTFCIKRKLFSSLKRLLCGIAYTYHYNHPCDDINLTNWKQVTPGNTNNINHNNNNTNSARTIQNPFWEAMGYPGPPMDWSTTTNHTMSTNHTNTTDQERVQAAMIAQLPIIHALQESQNRITKLIEQRQQRHQQQKQHEPLQLDCDIIIIGSGAGGCVTAHNLSKLGYHVMVLEQAKYVAPIHIVQSEIQCMEQQYIQCGLLQNTSGTIMILGANAFGGGTAINWSCCLSLPEYIIHDNAEWNRTIASNMNEYKEAQQYILNQLGVVPTTTTSHTTVSTTTTTKAIFSHHNTMNQKLQIGCNALNYQWEETGQNLRDPSDATAGHIGMGDRYNNKNGGMQSFLIDAVKRGNTTLLEQCEVLKICTSYTTSGRRRATGVECRVFCSYDGTYRNMIVQARKSVVVAAGALYSPILLRKSGLRNRHIGKHLRLHPVAAVMGFFPEPIHSILGAPMTTVCNEFVMGPNHDGYGAKIECPCSYPGLIAAGSPWISGQVYKDRMLQYNHAVPLIVLQRDTGDGGSVRESYVDGKSLVIEYNMNRNDNKSIVEAMQGAVRILVAAGAKEVATGHIYDTGFKVSDTTKSLRPDNECTELLDDYIYSIQKRGTKDHEINLFSAHQMGTCRMSVSCTGGVVDVNGETWECDDLYVLDSSVFPTASGSNPMVTVMTIAHVLSTRLGETLQQQDKYEIHDISNEWRTKRKQQSSMELSIVHWLRNMIVPISLVVVVAHWYNALTTNR